MEKFAGIAAVLAISDTGYYPQMRRDKAGVKTDRTEKQEGWNDCASSISSKAAKIEDYLDELPPRIAGLVEAETLRVSIRDDDLKLWVLCNDLFFWGCADGEDFELSDLPGLEKALEESSDHGEILWCCRKREMRPQKPYYKYFNEAEVKLFDACGPERNE